VLAKLIAATALAVSTGTLPITLPPGWHVVPKPDVVIARWAAASDTLICLDQVTTGSLRDLDADICSLTGSKTTPTSNESATLCGMAAQTERFAGEVGGRKLSLTRQTSQDAAGNIFVLRRIAPSDASQVVEPAIAQACPTAWWSLGQPAGYKPIAQDDPTPVAMFKQPTKHAIVVFSLMPVEFLSKGLAQMKAQLLKQGRTMTPATFCGHPGYLFDMSLSQDLIDVGMNYDSTMAIVPGPRYAYMAADFRDRGAKPDPEALAALTGLCPDQLPPMTWPYPKDAP
jgi:hypothetical protein